MLERVALLLAREFFHCAPCVSLFFTCPLAIKLPFPFKENKLAASRRGTISTFSHLHGTGTHPYAHVREWEREDKRKKKHKGILKFFWVFSPALIRRRWRLRPPVAMHSACSTCCHHVLFRRPSFIWDPKYHLRALQSPDPTSTFHNLFSHSILWPRAYALCCMCLCTGRMDGRPGDVCSPGKRSAACAVHHENLNAPTVPTWIQIYLLSAHNTQPHTPVQVKNKARKRPAAYKLPDMGKTREQFSFDFLLQSMEHHQHLFSLQLSLHLF